MSDTDCDSNDFDHGQTDMQELGDARKLELHRDVSRSLRRPGIDEQLGELIEFVGLNSHHLACRSSLGEFFSSSLDDMTECFYKFIRQHPAVKNLISEEEIGPRREALREWATSLFQQPLDEKYARWRQEISSRHLAMGIDQRLTAGAFSIVRSFFQRRILEQNLTSEELLLQLETTNKMLDLDLTLIGECYHQGRRNAIVGEKDAEKLNLEERLESVVRSEHMMMLSIDVDHRVTSVNEACLNLFGWPESEVVGMNFIELFEDKRAQKLFRVTISGWFDNPESAKKLALVPQPIRTRGDRVVQIIWSCNHIHDRRGNVHELLLLGHDVTEQRLLQGQILQQEKMAAIGLLAAGVAHEIGNPLASISSVTQTLRRKSSDDYVTSKLNLIASHIDRITNIVRQMVNFARPPRHEWGPVQINDLIRGTREILRYDRRAKLVGLELDLDPELPAINAVEDQLTQVFFNMAVNALDALGSAPGLADPMVRVRTRKSETDFGPTIEVIYEDNGPGIPDEDATRVFEPFFTTKEVGHGTGLGLSVSYRVVQDHGGRIRVDGRLGKGARFKIELPLNKRKTENS